MAECLTPFGVKNKFTNETIPVPCGKCPECLKRRVSSWSFRLMEEGKVSTSSHFITLTYDTKHVPITSNGFMSLSKSDLQKFYKRLRKAHLAHSDYSREIDPVRIKYYSCGEYGGKTKRPHYHLILFNSLIELIQPAWDKGEVHYGEVTGASIGYTLKYMTKTKRIPLHKNDDRIPEFALMSKGLGESYLNKKMIQWHHADMDGRMYCNLKGGKKIAMPRYYKNKLYAELERKRIGFFARIEMLKRKESEMNRLGDSYFREMAEQAKYAFRNMEYKSRQDRNKI